MKHTHRAPNGYRIVQWADGFYHVYPRNSGGCLGEFLSHREARECAIEDKYRKMEQEATAHIATQPEANAA